MRSSACARILLVVTLKTSGSYISLAKLAGEAPATYIVAEVLAILATAAFYIRSAAETYKPRGVS